MFPVFLVPFRSGSKAILSKNMRRVNRSSLAARAVKFGLESNLEGVTVASTDSLKMLRAVTAELGYKVPDTLSPDDFSSIGRGLFVHYRPPEQALDTSPLGPLISKTMAMVGQQGLVPSHLVLLQPTSPFRTASDAHHLLSLLASVGPEDSAVSVTRVDDAHPARMYLRGNQPNSETLERVAGFDEHEFSPRQNLPSVYLRDGAFYILGSNQARRGAQLGETPFFFERAWPYTVNIDSPRDLTEARRIAKRFQL